MTGLQAQAQDTSSTLWPKWGPFIDLEGKVGTKRNLGEADLFVPLWQNERSMLFGDARFKADDQNSHEGNFGLGFRQMLNDGWNAGLYGFYDHRRSPNANLFDQLTFGAELLGTDFDVRANSYWPIGNTEQPVGAPTTGPSTASVSGSALQVLTPATMQTMEFALRGFDAEAGARIPITPAESPYNVRIYAGGFYFDSPTGLASVIAGPRIRLEFTDYQVPGLWNGTRFTVGGEWQTDDVRGSQFFAGLRLRVPLETEPRRASFTLQERRMTNAIVRDVDIVANTQSIQVAPSITETATETASGKTITAISSSTTSGANLPTAIANAGTNSFVVLQGTFNTTATTALQSGQTIMGSGSLALKTASGRTVTATLQGATINSTTTAGNGAVELPGSTTLSGLTINVTAAGTVHGVIMNDTAQTATITNNTITATSTSNSAVGLQFGLNNNNVTVSGNSVTAKAASGQTAIAFGANNGGATYTISGNTFSASGGTINRAVTVTNDTFSASSTGNVKAAGVCNNGGGNTGSISFTDGTTCP